MKQLIFALCLTIISLECAATDFVISAVEILGYGIVESRSSKSRIGYSKESIAIDAVEDIRLLQHTSDIPGVLGTEFGMLYKINSTPKGAQFQVTSVIKFPEGGLTDEKGKVYEQATETFNVAIGERSFYCFGFDEQWEIVPGKWVFQIWHKNSRLAQRTFNVLPQESSQ
jgi:hypothetical protein